MEGDEGIFSKVPDFRELQLGGGGDFQFLPFYPHVSLETVYEWVYEYNYEHEYEHWNTNINASIRAI